LLPISSITVYNQSFVVPLISLSFALKRSYPLLILSLAAYQLLSPFAIDHLSYLYLFVLRLYKATPFADLIVQLLILISHFRDFFVQLLGKIFAS